MNGTLYYPEQLASEINKTYYNDVNGTLQSLYSSPLIVNATIYQAVQLAIETGLKDFTGASYIQRLGVKTTNLYTGIQSLLNGLLGQNGSPRDVLDAVIDKNGVSGAF